MKIKATGAKESNIRCDALILPFFEGAADAYDRLGRPFGRLISGVFGREFKGTHNEVMLLPSPDGIAARWILLLGLGRPDELSAEKLRQSGGKALGYLRDNGIRTAALSTSLFSANRLDPIHFIDGALLGLYTYGRYKKNDNKKKVDSLVLLAKPSKELPGKIRRAAIVSDAVAFAKDLVNAPANDLTPSDLARAALGMKGKALSVKVLNRKAAEKSGMGLYLAVARGSAQEPKFIIAEYKGSRKQPVVLIGKSITFDSGGLSLKPSDGMEKMKYDMAGGAAVLGVIKAAAAMSLPAHIIGLLPATENLPGGTATRPGDVIRSLGGKTVEIANTDAEGRLAVADAIEYAKKYRPSAIVDIATLTGACAIAFGGEVSALMGNDKELTSLLMAAGDEAYERLCELPLYDEYKEYLKSDIADIRNIGNRTGSLMASGYFLHEFAGTTPWAHIDIAGTAWTEKDRPYTPKGATAFGLRLLLNFIERYK